MTNEADAPPPGKHSGARGCLLLATVFLVISFAGTLVTLILYSFVVDQGLIAVPREFGYEMALYAPLAGLVCGLAAAFWSRGRPSARRVPLLLSLGLIIPLALLLVFLGLDALLWEGR